MPLPRSGRFKKKVESSSESSSSSEDEAAVRNPTSDTISDEKSGRKKKFELVADDAEDDDGKGEPIGVIRASQQSENRATLDLEKGTIKNLAHMFQNINHSKETQSKQPFVMDIDDNDGEVVLESTPLERFEGVVRAADPSEWQKPIDVQRGATKDLASRFLKRTMQDPQPSKKPFKMELDEDAEPTVLESEPVVLEGVVRSSDKPEEIRSKKGRIKNLAKGFFNLSQEESQDTERGVVPASRTVGQRWRDSQLGEEDGERPRGRIELDAAPEFGVYENEPEVRDDVVRAGEDQPDVIHVKHTRNLKKMWCQFEKSEMEKEQNSKNIDFRVKKKEEEPPPPKEPTPPPKEEPKKKSWAARRKEVQKPTPTIQPEQNTVSQKTSLRSTTRKRL